MRKKITDVTFKDMLNIIQHIPKEDLDKPIISFDICDAFSYYYLTAIIDEDKELCEFYTTQIKSNI